MKAIAASLTALFFAPMATAHAQTISDTSTVRTWLESSESEEGADIRSTTSSLLRLMWFYGWRAGYLSGVEDTPAGHDYEECVRRIEPTAARATIVQLLESKQIERRTLIGKAMREVAIMRCGALP